MPILDELITDLGHEIGTFVLGPLTMERFKGEICPKSKHLSDIVGIRYRGYPVIASPGLEEGMVGYSEDAVDDKHY